MGYEWVIFDSYVKLSDGSFYLLSLSLGGPSRFSFRDTSYVLYNEGC